MYKQRKFYIWMSVWLSLSLVCLLRLDTPSNSDGERALTLASAVGEQAKLIPQVPMYDIVGTTLKGLSDKQTTAAYLRAHAQRVQATSSGRASIVHQASYQSLSGIWDQFATCESHNIWNLNTGNGFFGGLQEDMQFWYTYGPRVLKNDQMVLVAPRPDLATREQQIEAAQNAHDSGRGYSPWPTCRRVIGV